VKRTLTPAQEAARAERKAKQAALFARLAKLTLCERAKLAQTMPVLNPDGHRLSVSNMCMLGFQREHVTVVAGFRQWLAHGRCVRRGERGLTIRVPCAARLDAESTESSGVREVYFVGGTVFDVSQTEALSTHAENLPAIAEAREMEAA
jgi:antirestriction protein ArdC